MAYIADFRDNTDEDVPMYNYWTPPTTTTTTTTTTYYYYYYYYYFFLYFFSNDKYMNTIVRLLRINRLLQIL